MAQVELKNLSKKYGKVTAVQNMDLIIPHNQFLVLVGPSGCGKSTTLRMIAGLEEITGGEIFINDERVNDKDPKDRNVSMVFQNYALYPHMSVEENLGFSLKIAKVKSEEIEKRVNEAVNILGLEDLRSRKPSQLSGGQRQRVAMGRAIVRRPDAFLFDEPLSNLDAKLRNQMRTEIKKLHQKLKTTIIYVTHDQVEAMTLADRIVVLNQGVIEQVGTPIELYSTPKNQFVAEFIGSPKMNIIDIENSNNNLKNINTPNLTSRVGIRPEHLFVAQEGDTKLKGSVRHIENLGEHLLCYINIGGDNEITAKLDVSSPARLNQEISLSWISENTHYFNNTGISVS